MSKKFTPKDIEPSPSAFPADAPKRDPQSISIPLSKVKPSSNPRRDLGDLTELKASIAQDGLLYPLLVRKTGDEFELLGGYRRYECLKQLDRAEAFCRVIDTNQPELIKLIDNLLRQQLDPESEALGVKSLLPLFGGNQSSLARAISKSPTYVSRMLKAADLIESGLCAGAKSPLSKSAIMELADSPNPEATLAASADGRKNSIRNARDPKNSRLEASVDGDEKIKTESCLSFRATNHGGWYLRVKWNPAMYTEELRSEIVARLQKQIESLMLPLQS